MDFLLLAMMWAGQMTANGGATVTEGCLRLTMDQAWRGEDGATCPEVHLQKEDLEMKKKNIGVIGEPAEDVIHVTDIEEEEQIGTRRNEAGYQSIKATMTSGSSNPASPPNLH